MKTIWIALCLCVLSCAKEEHNPEPSPSPYSVTSTPPEEVSVTISVNGIERTFTDGVNGYGLLDATTCGTSADQAMIHPIMNMDQVSPGGTAYAGNISVSLPTCAAPIGDWTTSTSQTFLNYFNGVYGTYEPSQPSVVFVTEDGQWWMNSGEPVLGDAIHCYEVEFSSYPATVRVYGYLSIPMFEGATGQEAMASVVYTARFHEPL